jgi:two-component system response regulator FixJ
MAMSSDRVIYLIDDDAAVREALVFLLSTAGFTARAFASGDDFLASLSSLESGCIVTDVRMPGIDGLGLQTTLRQRGITLPVIIMTGHGDVPLAVAAMKAGASDFIEKPFSDATLLEAIATAMRRQGEAAQRHAEVAGIRARLAALSARQRDVLAGLVSGQMNKTIAHELDISVRTVEVYRAALMSRMKASSLSELVRMVMLAGPPADTT